MTLVRRFAFSCAALVLLAAAPSLARAQVRERLVSFDSAGRIFAITPPLAARLALAPPAWPVSGDYVDVRLYALDEGAAVLVVRRPREVLERFTLSASQRAELSAAVERGVVAQRAAGGPDSLPTRISDPVRGWFVANQTILGVALFAPAAAAVAGNAAGGTAAYLAVAGGTFFLAADRARRIPISSAQNHLAWKGAFHGSTAAALAAYSLGGESMDAKVAAGASLAGGIIGDVVGYSVAQPMTDAEAHGVSHGAFVTTTIGLGGLVTGGMWKQESSRRVATALLIGAGAVGYPLGLHYARNTSYRVTAGDVGTLVAGELIGTAAVASFIPESSDDEKAIAAVLTAGFFAGAIGADRFFARPFDYGEAESRLLQFGTIAGAVVGLAVPVMAEASNPQIIFGPAAVGGLLGAALTHRLIAPARAGASPRRTGALARPSRVAIQATPQNLLFARAGRPGTYPVLSMQF